MFTKAMKLFEICNCTRCHAKQQKHITNKL